MQRTTENVHSESGLVQIRSQNRKRKNSNWVLMKHNLLAGYASVSKKGAEIWLKQNQALEACKIRKLWL